MALTAVALLGIVLGYVYQSRLKPSPISPIANAIETASPSPPTVAASSTTPLTHPQKRDPNAIPGERVLRFKSDADFQHFLDEARKRGINILGVIPALRAVRVGAASDAIITQLLQGFDTAQIGENFVVGIPPDPSSLPANSPTPLVPFNQNWIKAMGVNAVDPNWGHGVKVAVVDSGIDPSFIASGGQIQSIDLVGAASTTTTGGTDSFSHGTAVASLITGDGSQLPGVAPNTSLLSIKVLNDDGEGDSFTVAEGIIRAVDAGSQIINLSLGSSSNSAVMQDAILYAENHGVAIVAAAGNDGVAQVSYPAQYSGVLGVGSVDATLQPAYFSNSGTGLELMAPGVGLPAGQPGNQAVSFSGTSASTATVSGLLAAVLSNNPGMTGSQAVTVLEKYADDLLTPGWDAQTGFGMADMNRVSERNTPNILDGAVASQFILSQSGPNQPIKLGITVQNQGTAPIWNSMLTVQVGGVSNTFAVENLGPTQSVMNTVNVYPYQLANGSVTISSQYAITGASDRNSANNTMRSNLKITSPTASK